MICFLRLIVSCIHSYVYKNLDLVCTPISIALKMPTINSKDKQEFFILCLNHTALGHKKEEKPGIE